MRILVADDDALFHRLTEAIFQGGEYELLHAMDGTQALALYHDQRPDLVLTDYRMPGMDGIELCRSIKALDPDRFVPVILVTGEGEPRLRHMLPAGVLNEVEDSRASGRGLLIIRSLASDMSFNESGNGLRFTLPCG